MLFEVLLHTEPAIAFLVCVCVLLFCFFFYLMTGLCGTLNILKLMRDGVQQWLKQVLMKPLAGSQLAIMLL